MLTAFSYVRFSSKPQELGDSLKRQVKLARDYATTHDLFLDERSYHDLGVSAWKGKNAVDGALAAFLKAVDCRRRSKSDPPCRSNIDPGMEADRVIGRLRASVGLCLFL